MPLTSNITVTDFELPEPQVHQPLDENLTLAATQRLLECQGDLGAFIAGSPTVRGTLTRMLQDRLQLDGERTGIVFVATDERSTRQLTLTEACLYMQQHPSLDTATVPAGSLYHLPQDHAYAGLPLPQLLDTLKALDLRQALKDAWTAYLASRAPLTPMTWRARVAELYNVHLEACSELLLAQRDINADALVPIFSIIDSTAADSSGPTVYIESVALKLSATDHHRAPGAWVLTLDTEQPVTQLLYLPANAPGWHVFGDRNALERWLLDHQQAVFSTQEHKPLATIEYTASTTPLETGISQYLDHLIDNQYLNAIKPLDSIAIDGDAYRLLQHVNTLDTRRLGAPVLGLPAQTSAAPPNETIEVDLPQFGYLHAAIPLSQRHARVQVQQSAILTLLDAEPTDSAKATRLQQLQTQLDSLREQQTAAIAAADAMLKRRPFDLATLNHQYTALSTARLAGLRLEAKIQHDLSQISEDELTLIETVLDTPALDKRQRSVAVASMALAVTEQTNATTRITKTELKGPLVIAASLAPTFTGSCLVYWPGSGGALQRFESRQAMEQTLFQISPNDSVLALHLDELGDDPFDESLQAQQTDFEEKAATLRATWTGPTETQKLTSELAALCESTLATLVIPEHRAREAALLEIVEQNNSSLLATQMPEWLRTQTAETLDTTKASIRHYLTAVTHANALMEQSLSPRATFVTQQIDARLRKDFAIKQGYSVQLELPDSVDQRREIVSGGGPGTPMREVNVPSDKHSKMSLETLTLENIDDAMTLRLGFMTLEVSADDAGERNLLEAGLTREYLIGMTRDLDMAQKYENLIVHACMGFAAESTFQKAYRRECLIEPWRWALRLQGMFTFMQALIDAQALQIWNIAIDADSHDAWKADGKHIELLPASLTVGKDDDTPVTLSGVTFVQEHYSKTTLLYLPDVPGNRCLRRYDDLEAARKGLYDLCRTDEMTRYIASRAIKGDVDTHIKNIRLAVSKNFDALIAVGVPWPVTTSMAAHQLNAHMGRLIEAHRNDSRSHRDLALERYLLKGSNALWWMKTAMGFLPFIGTAISLGDAGTSLATAVKAFREGKIYHGVEALASVFESLVSAAIDVAPGVVLPTLRAGNARKLTFNRQRLWRPRYRFWKTLNARQAKNTTRRFEGYEFNEPLDPASLQRVMVGPYRHTWRHTSGDHFIISQGRYFKVRFDKTAHEMRLVAKGKFYSPVIELDDALEWNTYSALHKGQLTAYTSGSGRGRRGRGSQGAPADKPAAVRAQIPEPMARVNEQRNLMLGEVRRNYAELAKQINTSNDQLKNLNTQLGDAKATSNFKHNELVRQTTKLEPVLIKDIDDAVSLHAQYERVRGFDASMSGAVLAKKQDILAHVIAERSIQRINYAQKRMVLLDQHIHAIDTRMTDAGYLGPDYFHLCANRKQVSLNFLEELTQTESAMKQLNTWYAKMSTATKNKVKSDVTVLIRLLSDRALLFAKTSSRLKALQNPPLHAVDISWMYQNRLLTNGTSRLNRVLDMHVDLPNAKGLGTAQYNQVLQQSIDAYHQFSRDLMSWSIISPIFFDETITQPFLRDLDSLTQQAQRSMKSTRTPQPATAVDKGTKTAFEAEDGRTLIGKEPLGERSPRRFIVSNQADEIVEVWDEIGSSAKYRLNATASPPTPALLDLPTNSGMIIAEARTCLDEMSTMELKARDYTTMAPVSIEDIFTGAAKNLESRASRIADLEPSNTLIQQLHTRARALRTAGQRVRIERSLASEKPTEGYLDYLMEKDAVRIKKNGPRVAQEQKRPDGLVDYLQKYDIYDKARPATDKPIWCAHFHYTAADSPFGSFAKAHLKLKVQERLGMKWQISQIDKASSFADVAIWRGSIGLHYAVRHFQALG